MITTDQDPYEAFHLWLLENGYADVAEAEAEEIDLERLEKAIIEYQGVAS
jgi:hypothetical protein